MMCVSPGRNLESLSVAPVSSARARPCSGAQRLAGLTVSWNNDRRSRTDRGRTYAAGMSRCRELVIVLACLGAAGCGADGSEPAAVSDPREANPVAPSQTTGLPAVSEPPAVSDVATSPSALEAESSVFPGGLPPIVPLRYLATVETGPAIVRLYRQDSPSWNELSPTGGPLPPGGCGTGTITAEVSTDRVVGKVGVRTLANPADGPVGVIKAVGMGEGAPVWVFVAQVPPESAVSVMIPHGEQVPAVVVEDFAVAVGTAISLDIDHLPQPVTMTINGQVFTTSPAQGSVMLMPILTSNRPGCYPLFDSSLLY